MDSSYKSIFNLRGNSYHQVMVKFPEARNQEFKEIIHLANPRPGQVICDAPSGGGYLARYLPQGCKIIAIETSEIFYKHCVATNLYHQTILSPLDKINLPDSSIDCLISLAGLHHLSYLEQQKFFQEAYRIMRDGAIFCVADVLEGTPPAKFLNIFVNKYNSMGHNGKFFTKDSPYQFAPTGLKIIESSYKTYYWTFLNVDTMCQYLMLLFGLDLATPNIVLDGITTYLRYDTDKGRCKVNWGLLFVKGIKCK
jgi:SAM-dependent methyltransferase